MNNYHFMHQMINMDKDQESLYYQKNDKLQ